MRVLFCVMTVGFLLGGLSRSVFGDDDLRFTYQPGPADNPLKGFIPFAGPHNNSFPHSMEWAAFPLNQLMDGPDQFRFETQFESTVGEIASRGHQTVMRVYLDYPGRESGIPQYLLNGALRRRHTRITVGELRQIIPTVAS